MVAVTRSANEIGGNAERLLKALEDVQNFLRRRGYSNYASEVAVTAVYRAAEPYFAGTKVWSNVRAWAFKVAIPAAIRAARREIRCRQLEPAIVAASVNDSEPREQFDIHDVLSQLTDRQREAVEHCILGDMSHSEAAESIGIKAG